MDTDTMELDEEVFENVLISTYIFSFLNFKDLLKCRSVSYLWAKQVKGHLKGMRVKFELTESPENCTSKKVKFCKNYGITNISLTEGICAAIPSSRIADFEAFLSQIGLQIKSIKLVLEARTPNLISIIKTACKLFPDAVELIFDIPSYKNISNYTQNSTRKLTFDLDFRPRSILKLLCTIEEAEQIVGDSIKKNFPEQYQEQLLNVLLTTFQENIRYAQSLPSVFDIPFGQPGSSSY